MKDKTIRFRTELKNLFKEISLLEDSAWENLCKNDVQLNLSGTTKKLNLIKNFEMHLIGLTGNNIKTSSMRLTIIVNFILLKK